MYIRIYKKGNKMTTQNKCRLKYSADGKYIILLIAGLRVVSKINLQKNSVNKINKFLGDK